MQARKAEKAQEMAENERKAAVSNALCVLAPAPHACQAVTLLYSIVLCRQGHSTFGKD